MIIYKYEPKEYQEIQRKKGITGKELLTDDFVDLYYDLIHNTLSSNTSRGIEELAKKNKDLNYKLVFFRGTVTLNKFIELNGEMESFIRPNSNSFYTNIPFVKEYEGRYALLIQDEEEPYFRKWGKNSKDDKEFISFIMKNPANRRFMNDKEQFMRMLKMIIGILDQRKEVYFLGTDISKCLGEYTDLKDLVTQTKGTLAKEIIYLMTVNKEPLEYLLNYNTRYIPIQRNQNTGKYLVFHAA